jgi:hypothetical protein
MRVTDAAQELRVSRLFLNRLIDTGTVPHTVINGDRDVSLRDVKELGREFDVSRNAPELDMDKLEKLALDELERRRRLTKLQE